MRPGAPEPEFWQARLDSKRGGDLRSGDHMAPVRQAAGCT